MKILIATTEFSPLTPPSPIGDAAALMAKELHRSRDVEVAVALPASPALLTEHRDCIRDINVRLPLSGADNPPPEARILEARLDSAPQVFLVDAGSGQDHPPLDTPDRSIADACSFSQALAEMLVRLEPPIHLVHCFGWQPALTTLVLPSRGLACRTAFTPETEFGWSPGPPGVDEVRDFASRHRLSNLAELLSSQTGQSITQLCLHAADRVIPLNDDQSGSAPSTSPEQLQGLSPRPIVFVPTTLATPVLEFADRLLIDGASLAVQHASTESNPALAAAIEALKLRFPGQVALLAPPPAGEFLRLPNNADILLVLPPESSHPEAPGRIIEATAQGHFAVAPHGTVQSHDEKTCSYGGADPESIWCALNRALDRYRRSAPSDALSHPSAGRPTPPLPSPGTFLYRSHDAYRELVIKTLADAAA
jgi:hypothetical protein